MSRTEEAPPVGTMTPEQLAEALHADGLELTTPVVRQLPEFSAADRDSWPEVLERRPATVDCVIACERRAENSALLGRPHTDVPQRWLDLCRPHAEELDRAMRWAL